MPDGQKRVAAALPGNSAQCPDRASGAVYAKLPEAGAPASTKRARRLCQAVFMPRAHLDKRPGDISAMFDAVAERYDLLNDVLSLGQDRRWRSAVARAVAAGPADLVLDVAAGTGTSSRAFTSARARCVACDFSLGMLSAGARRPASLVSFVAGDALALPFADEAFDAVTISFGLRNVASPEAALAEMRRVTKPGGTLAVCEFSHLLARPLDAAYQRYLAAVLPAVAGTLPSRSAPGRLRANLPA